VPSEVAEREHFMKLSEKAAHCRVVRQGDEVKLKLRTPRRLYTMRLDASEAEVVLKELKCKVFELNKEKKTRPKTEAAQTRPKSETTAPTPHEKQE
jgi:hypothetical protein